MALQTQETPTGERRHAPCQMGLARPRRTLAKDRPPQAQGQEDGGRGCRVGKIPVLVERGAEFVRSRPESGHHDQFIHESTSFESESSDSERGLVMVHTSRVACSAIRRQSAASPTMVAESA